MRYKQKNLSEAMLHSFRAIEGSIGLWAEKAFTQRSFIKFPKRGYPKLKKGICSVPEYKHLEEKFIETKDKSRDDSDSDSTIPKLKPTIDLYLNIQEELLKVDIPEVANNLDFKAFWSKSNKDQRNKLSHRLGGLSENELFKAWGEDISTCLEWETRIINCINVITKEDFQSLDIEGFVKDKNLGKQASLMAQVHQELVKAIVSL